MPRKRSDDEKSGELSPEESRIVELITEKLFRISEKENNRRPDLQMLKQVFHFITQDMWYDRDDDGSDYEEIIEFVKEAGPPKGPNAKNLQNEIDEILSEYLGEADDQVSVAILNFIRWWRTERPMEQSTRILYQLHENMFPEPKKALKETSSKKTAKKPAGKVRFSGPKKGTQKKDSGEKEERVPRVNLNRTPRSTTAPEYLEIKKLPGGDFIVWGKPLAKYAPRLLEMGGSYPTISESGERKENRSYISFRGAAYTKNKEILMKPVAQGGYGAIHPKQKGRGVGHLPDTSSAYVSGITLKNHREELEKMGGRYAPMRSSQKALSRTDYSRIRFKGFHLSRVESFLSSLLPEDERFRAVFQEWVDRKVQEIADTCLQTCILSGKDTVGKDTVKLVIERIYNCRDLPFSTEDPFPGIRYVNISKILSRKENTDYSFDPEALEYLADYARNISSVLLSTLTSFTLKSLSESMKIINEAIFEKITQYVEGIKMFDGSNIEICVVNAFRKVALTYDEMFPGNDRDKLVVQAILTVLPQEWRDSCLQRVEEAIMHQLEGNKIPLEYLDRIRRIIDHLDRDSDSKLCGNICDVSTLIILYVSMIYTAGLVEKTGPEKSIGKLRRFCVLGM